MFFLTARILPSSSLPAPHTATLPRANRLVDVEILIQYQKVCVCAFRYTALDSFFAKEYGRSAGQKL